LWCFGVITFPERGFGRCYFSGKESLDEGEKEQELDFSDQDGREENGRSDVTAPIAVPPAETVIPVTSRKPRPVSLGYAELGITTVMPSSRLCGVTVANV
jgi:hypothetical protein